SVVVKVSKSTTSAAMRLEHTGPSWFTQFFESSVAQVPKQRPRRLVGILRQLAFDLRIYVAGNHEYVRIAVVVEIDDARSPADVAGFNRDPGSPRYVVEVPLAYIVI